MTGLYMKTFTVQMNFFEVCFVQMSNILRLWFCLMFVYLFDSEFCYLLFGIKIFYQVLPY